MRPLVIAPDDGNNISDLCRPVKAGPWSLGCTLAPFLPGSLARGAFGCTLAPFLPGNLARGAFGCTLAPFLPDDPSGNKAAGRWQGCSWQPPPFLKILFKRCFGKWHSPRPLGNGLGNKTTGRMIKPLNHWEKGARLGGEGVRRTLPESLPFPQSSLPHKHLAAVDPSARVPPVFSFFLSSKAC